jgi:short-subunit dehydrogenase
VPLTYDQFRYSFANAVGEEEAHQLYETYAVPAAGAGGSRRRERGKEVQPSPPVRRMLQGGHPNTVERRSRMIGQRDLSDSVVVVTGASSGIGRAASIAFAAHGSSVVLAARGEEALAEAERLCAAEGARTLAVPTDVADPEAIERLRASAVERFGRIDVWVEAAAVLVAGPLGSESVEEIERLIDTNVLGTVLGSRAALGQFGKQGQGGLILVGSLLGVVPNPLVPLYSMTKFAVRGLALNLRRAVAGQRGISVSLVLPGPVDTPMFEHGANHTGHELRAIPPATSPERVAAAIVACARRPRRQTTAGVLSHTIRVTHRLAPRLTEWAVATWSAPMLKRPNPAPDSSGGLFDGHDGAGISGGWRLGSLRRRIGDRVGSFQAQRR